MNNTEKAFQRVLLDANTTLPVSESLQRHSSVSIAVLLILATVTFAFGGVHNSVLLPVEICLYSLGILLIKQSFTSVNTPSTNSHLCLLLLLLTLAYCGGQLALLSSCREPHPVLVQQSCHPAAASAGSSILFMGSCIAFFFISTTLLATQQNFLRLSSLCIWILGLSVTLISLSHWFYDSGKLFWTFAPEHIFPSSRARWPFVNANHLGHFLLLILFFALGIFRISIDRFQKQLFETPRFSEQPLLRILPRPQYLYPLIRLCFQAVLILALLLSVAASLSRSTWVGMLVGIIVLSVLSIVHKSSLPEPAILPIGLRTARRRKRKRTGGTQQNFQSLKKRINLALAAAITLLFCFFLSSGQGIELVEGRIEFGFAASKSDIRWMLYDDSINLLKMSPLTGIGLAAWSTVYNRVMSPELANVTPEYLHSDPFQLYIELGLLGLAPMLCMFIWLSFNLLTRPPKNYSCILAHSLYAGIVGLLCASFLDFPFRIPAICYLLMLALSILTYLLDNRDENDFLNKQLKV